MHTETFVFSFLTLIFLIFGVIFYRGRGVSLIAGYNSMNDEEKEKINETKLLRAMRNMSFSLAFSTGIWMISSLLNENILFYIGLILFLISIIATIFYINTNVKLN